MDNRRIDNMTQPLPIAENIEVGDTVYSREYPGKEFKVKGIIVDIVRGGKEYLKLEDKDTKEISWALYEHITKTKPDGKEGLWRETWKPADTPLSSELMVMKKAGAIDANLKESAIMAVMPAFQDIFGVSTDVVESFLKQSSFHSVDNNLVINNGSKTIIASMKDNSVQYASYIVGEREVDPRTFFSHTGKIVISSMGQGLYVIEMCGEKNLLEEDELTQFCHDWKINNSVVRATLSQHGKYTFEQE
jgi:hypothetical protein